MSDVRDENSICSAFLKSEQGTMYNMQVETLAMMLFQDYFTLEHHGSRERSWQGASHTTRQHWRAVAQGNKEFG